MKKFISLCSKFAVGVFVVMCLFISSHTVHASITPVLSLSSTGDGNSVQINVSGDPNVSVLLYYLKSGTSGQQIISLGTTNSNGIFSTTITSSSYGIVTNTPVYVTTNGIGGVASATVYWPSVTTSLTNQFSLSQSAAVLSAGSSVSISTNNSSGSIYVSNNSNPSIVNVNVSGTQMTVTGNTPGTSVITICSTGSSVTCPTLYITVQNAGTPNLVFSQNNIMLYSGQNTPISVSGGNGMYTISNNSNTSLVSASISGQTINLNTTGGSGVVSLTICATDMSSCGVLNVTVGVVNNSTVLSFNQSNPTVSIGQSVPITVYGGSGSYYISSNQNQNIVQANVSGSIVTLYGIASGSDTISVCASSGGCAQLSVSVNYISNGGTLSLSQTSLSLLTNQTLGVTISGGTAPYNLPITSSPVFQAYINGNMLNVTGLSSGTTQIAVCSANGGCTWLSLIVNGSNSNYGNSTIGSTSFLILSQYNPSISVGQNTTISLLNGVNGSAYTIAYNSNPSVASAIVNGNILTLMGVRNGYSVVVVCDSNNDCAPVSLSVGYPSVVIPLSTVSSNSVTTTTGFIFTQTLYFGSYGNEVSELQQRLTSEGVYSGPINGRFGNLTREAVKEYQRIHAVTQTGTVGAITRSVLNARKSI